jgi:D-tyrosyl-tRNA(Tyr) deacylase
LHWVSGSGMSVRVVVQRVEEASILVDNVSSWENVGKGLVAYISFLKDANREAVGRAAKALLTAKLHIDAEGRPASIMESHGHILVVPQASLSGKLKGNRPQYHGQIEKEAGQELYQYLIDTLRQETAADEAIVIKHGTYGNRQGLKFASEGPFTHVLDF